MGLLEDQLRAESLISWGGTPDILDSWGTQIEYERIKRERDWFYASLPKPAPPKAKTNDFDLPPYVPPPMSAADIERLRKWEEQKRIEEAENSAMKFKIGAISVGVIMAAGLTIKAVEAAGDGINHIAVKAGYINEGESIFNQASRAPLRYNQPETGTGPAYIPPPLPWQIEQNNVPVAAAPIEPPQITADAATEPVADETTPQPAVEAANAALKATYETQLSRFFNAHHRVIRMLPDMGSYISNEMAEQLVSAPLNEHRFYGLQNKWTGASYVISTSPVTADGTINSIICATNGTRIIAFSRAASYYNHGQMHTEILPNITTRERGRTVSISREAKRMTDCEQAFDYLGKRYALPEISHI